MPVITAEAAAEHDTALEINANYLRLDLRDTHVKAALDAGALISINTDAHAPEQFDQMRYGVTTGRRGGPRHGFRATTSMADTVWLSSRSATAAR